MKHYTFTLIVTCRQRRIIKQNPHSMKKKALFLLLAFFALMGCKDKCESTICNNGAICEDGKCICPTGYTGPACEQRLVPTSISIKSISVNNYPLTTSMGESWDSDGDADLYLVLSRYWDPIESNTEETINDAVNLPVTWNTPSFIIPRIIDFYCIELYDKDELDEDELIGGMCFEPFKESNTGFPETIDLVDFDSTLSFRLSVEYSF